MSVTAAGGLSAYFQHADAAAASQAASAASGAAVAVTTGTIGATTTGGATSAAPATSATPVTAAASTPTGTATPTSPAAGSSTTGATAASLADGTYTGATDTNKWGPVQVQITVAGGQITDVVTTQTPTNDHKSVAINQRATPTLATEALSAQSAQIDTVSGATYTSDSYKVSLQSAIDLARSTAAQATAG